MENKTYEKIMSNFTEEEVEEINSKCVDYVNGDSFEELFEFAEIVYGLDGDFQSIMKATAATVLQSYIIFNLQSKEFINEPE